MPLPVRLTRLVLLLTTLVVISPAIEACGQEAVPVDSVRAAYARLDYDAAERMGRSVLEHFEAYAPVELAEVHTIVGFIAFARSDLDGARRAFRSALELVPTLRLDPRLVSPRIIELFEEVRGASGARTERVEAGEIRYVVVRDDGEIRYVVVRDARPAAALRSLALPGWGQLHLDAPYRGWLFVGLWGTTAGGALISHVRYRASRSAYLDERRAENVPALRETMDRWYLARNNLALGAAGVWIFALADALARGEDLPGDNPKAMWRVGRTRFGVSPGGVSIRIGVGGR